LAQNAREFGIEYFDIADDRQGITHVVGPEQGFTLPGATIVCRDSHTSTHGAFGALAFGIGASEVGLVLGTQSLIRAKSRTFRIEVTGKLGHRVTPKDLILHIIGKIGVGGAIGHAIEFTGELIRGLSMEGRMTVCNMSVEAGATVGMIAPDETTFAYLKDLPRSPKRAVWETAVPQWRTLRSDDHAVFDRELRIDADDVSPMVTWGTSPDDVIAIDGTTPDPVNESDPDRRAHLDRALSYMDLAPGRRIIGLPIDAVWIGSCTSGRISDLREAAKIVEGKRIADRLAFAQVVPGSRLVKKEAEREGLDAIFIAAGFEWSSPGCSMCIGMNGDQLKPGQRCASTSNRNFQHRQGRQVRTHLVSPMMAAAAAIAGHFVDTRHDDLGRDAGSSVDGR
jgi:3-isopropylmalate/(R)-2-methylmalate dehydratase large subunit